jgi:hypothetical protein
MRSTFVLLSYAKADPAAPSVALAFSLRVFDQYQEDFPVLRDS